MQKGQVQLSIVSTLSKSLDLADAKQILNMLLGVSFPNDLCSLGWNDKRTLAGAASEDIDLNSLTNAFGESISFSRVHLIYIRNKGTESDQVLKVGGASATVFSSIFANSSDILLVRPGGHDLKMATDTTGFVVSASAKLLKIENPGANELDYEIVILGS